MNPRRPSRLQWEGVRTSAPPGVVGPVRLGSEPWFLVLTLGLVAAGIFVASAVVHFHVALGGEGEPSGVLQSIVVSLYDGLGFVPTLYLSVLLALWAGIAFVSGKLGNPLRRIFAALLLTFCLSVLAAVVGGQGGSIGTSAAARLCAVLGSTLTTAILAVMCFAALLLSTEWFFFRFFLRLSGASSVPSLVDIDDVGLSQAEEDLLAARSCEDLDAAGDNGRESEVEAEAEPAGAGGGKPEIPVPSAAGEAGRTRAPAAPAAAKSPEAAGALASSSLASVAVQVSDAESARRSSIGEPRRDRASSGAPHGRSTAWSQRDRSSWRSRRGAERGASARQPSEREVLDEVLDEARKNLAGRKLKPDTPIVSAGTATGFSPSESRAKPPASGSGEEGASGAAGGDLFDEVVTLEANDPVPSDAVPSDAVPSDAVPSDPIASLEDPELLARAGEAIDEMLREGEPDSTQDTAALGEEHGPAQTRDAEPEEAAATEPEDSEADEPAKRVQEHLFASEQSETRPEPDGSAEQGSNEAGAEPGSDDARAEPVTEDTPDEVPAAGDDAAGEADVSVVDDRDRIERAVEVLLTSRRPTQVLLQRQLDLSAKQARELLAHLEELGVVRAPSGRGPWEPLIDLAEWKRRA